MSGRIPRKHRRPCRHCRTCLFGRVHPWRPSFPRTGQRSPPVRVRGRLAR